MRFSRVLIKFFCLPVLYFLAIMAMASSVTFASTTQQSAAQDNCPTLQIGSTDTNSQGKVSVLQTKLQMGPSDVDGKFGPRTRQAVISYQGGKQLTQDGIVGLKTWAALGGCAGSTPQPQTNLSATVPVTLYQDHTEMHNFADCSQKPIASCPVIEYLNKGTYGALCQMPGDTVSIAGLPPNDWWTRLQDATKTIGWVSNLYIKGGQQIAGVPGCNGNVPYIPPNPPAPSSALLNISVWKSGGEATIYPCTHPYTVHSACSSFNGSVETGSYPAYCQKVADDFYTSTGGTLSPSKENNMWTLIKGPNGPAWLPNVFITDAPNQQNPKEAFGKDANGAWQRVPDCGSTPPAGVSANLFKS